MRRHRNILAAAKAERNSNSAGLSNFTGIIIILYDELTTRWSSDHHDRASVTLLLPIRACIMAGQAVKGFRPDASRIQGKRRTNGKNAHDIILYLRRSLGSLQITESLDAFRRLYIFGFQTRRILQSNTGILNPVDIYTGFYCCNASSFTFRERSVFFNKNRRWTTVDLREGG